MRRKVTNERIVAGAMRFLVNVRGLHLDRARVLLVPVLLYGRETMIWKI